MGAVVHLPLPIAQYVEGLRLSVKKLRKPGSLFAEPATLALTGVDVVLLISLLLLLRWMLRCDNLDLRQYYLPWYEHILHVGRWRSLEGSFANYAPPYVYLLSAASVLHGVFAPKTVIKLAEVPGMIALGALGWSTIRALGYGRLRAVLSGLLLAMLPEVVTNALLWGQADVVYTVFLLAMVRLLLARRSGLAMAMFGVALAVKLQAMFAGPAIGAMLLAGELPWAALVWVPAAYAAMLVPAWLAGRPARALLTVYGTQVATYPDIAINVANPYQLLRHWASSSLTATLAVNRIGIVVALIVTVALMALMVRRPALWRGKGILAAVALPLLIEPYVLPKMHDRYFFPGNVLLVLLATVDREMLVPALLTQASAIAAYSRFLEGVPATPTFYALPALMVGVAIALVLRRYVPESRSAPGTPGTVAGGAAQDSAGGAAQERSSPYSGA